LTTGGRLRRTRAVMQFLGADRFGGVLGQA